jgi:hypothetical protein
MQRLSYLRSSIIFFTLAILTTLFAVVKIGEVQIPIELFSFFAFLIILIGVVYKLKDKPPAVITYLVFIGFVIKSIYAYYVFKTIISPFPDSFNYISNLDEMNYSDLSINSVSQISGTLQFGYYYLMYSVMMVFKTAYALYLANIFMFSLSGVMFYKLLKTDFGEGIAKVSAVVFLCSMNMLLFTSNILKDSLVLFLVMLSLFIYKQYKFKALVILPLIILFTVRIYAGASVAVAIIFDFIILGRLSLRSKIFGSLFTVIAVGVLNAFSFTDNYTRLIKSFITGSNPLELIVNPAISLFKFYFAPLFWNLIADPGVYLITFVDSLLAFICSFAVLLFIIKFIRSKELRSKMWIYLIPILIHALALGVQYGGDSTRQRIGVYGFIILTFVVGMFYKQRSQPDISQLIRDTVYLK